MLRFPGVLLKHRELIWGLSTREVLGRYKGSMLGRGWSFITPLLMLAVYTFVFSGIFKSRWDDLSHIGPLGFAINLFAGLIAFNLFAETAVKAPLLVLENSSYATKVVFPLEVLAAVNVAGALFNALTSVLVLAAFELLARHSIPPTILLLPLVWLPLLLLCLALSWFLAALGVFLRDIGQVVNVLVNMLMFLSAVFYPVSALPRDLQPYLLLNPLLLIVDQTRRITVAGLAPSLPYLLVGTLLGLVLCESSLRGFLKARRGFADVL